MIPLPEHYRSILLAAPTCSLLMLASMPAAQAGTAVDAADLSDFKFPAALATPSYIDADRLHYRPVAAGESPEEILEQIAHRLLAESVEAPAASVEVINEHFWDLLL